MLAQKTHDYADTPMACLKVDVKLKEKSRINIKIYISSFVLVVRVPFCLLNGAVLVEEIRQGWRI